MSDEVMDRLDQVEEEPQEAQPEQESEYAAYLRAKGVEPDDLPGIVGAHKAAEERAKAAEERLRQVEWTANQLAQRQAAPSPQDDEEDNVKAWEIWAKQNPNKVVERILDQRLSAARMADALDDVAATYMDKENGPEMFEMLKPIAMQLVQGNPGHYAGPPKTSVRRVFRDAEEFLKRNANIMAKIAGLSISEAGSQRTNAAMGAAAAGALGGANRQPLRTPGKEDQTAVLKRYRDAVDKGDTETMLELSLKHDWLSTKKPVDPWR